MAAHLVCEICGVEIILSESGPARTAEIGAFNAAHNRHDEGMRIAAIFELPHDGEAS